MSFFAELKRRNVIRVGIAYVVIAWLTMQFSDVVLNNIEAPGWVFQVIMLVLAIGFPFVLVFAWAFEMTPEGLKKEKDVDRSQSITPQTGKKLNNTILVLMALAIAYLLFDKFSGPAQPRTDHFSQQTVSQPTEPGEKSALSPVEAIAQAQAEAEPTIQRLSIAVLPFDNRSNREEDQFFTDGIHDDLLTTIARIGSMKVISRTSVMEYKNTTKKIREIAKELGVANILEGGIQRSGDHVRINVQLIDATTDEHLWAEIFDRELTANNLFAIQSEISQKIADALQATLTPEESKRINTMPTQNLAAYDAYMRGRQLMTTRETAKLEEATKEFREAVDLDPQFALAWVGVADSYNLLASYGSFNLEEALVIREDAVKHALEIDPGLGEAYASLATIHGDRGEYADMDSAFKKAIELSPNYATAYHWYGNTLLGLSRTQDAVDMTRKAAELDPRSAIIGSALASAYANQGLYSRAELQSKRVIELNPGFPQGYQSLANFYAFLQGRFDLAVENALTALKLDPGAPNSLVFLAWYSLEIGDEKAANQYRQMIADTSDQDWRVGWADMLISAAKNNAGGIREAWNWTSNRVPKQPQFFDIAAFLELAHGDPATARKIYLATEPDWIIPGSWGRLVDRDPSVACLVAWTLSQTNDEALGAALLDQTLTYYDALPGLVEHFDAWDPQFCYLMAGDTEKALTTIETQLADNDLMWWKTNDKLPMYEQIRFEPRYQAATAEYERRIAEQRKAVDQIKTGTGL